MTDELIERLSDSLRPTARYGVQRRLLLPVVGGLVVTTFLMLMLLGPRPDIGSAAATASFWIKSGYTFALAIAGTWAVERLSRPGGSARRPGLLTALIVAAMAIIAVAGYDLAPPDMREVVVWGSSALVCPFLIAGLSVPLLAAILAAMRRLAPTELTRAGAAAGLMAGGFGAWVYSFHCPENGLPFLALWYSLGVVIVIALGAISGRSVLRW